MIIYSKKQVLCIVLALFSGLYGIGQQKKISTTNSSSVSDYLSNIQTEPVWKRQDSIPLNFTTYHTQGLTRVGDYYFLSSVKVNRWPKKYSTPVNGFDRDNGDGTGYLFKFSKNGKLLDSIMLGKNEIYHPGGIDFDGKYIWVPVCEYRPNGKSIIYRINPYTMEATIVSHIADAIGAVAYNRNTNELTGMNWGSRKFYRWKINRESDLTTAVLQNVKGKVNPHFYVDFQDCNYIGGGKMFCSGLRAYKNAKGETIRLGGLELINMKDYSAILQLPVSEYTSNGTIMTNNPFFIDLAGNVLRCYFIPEDDQSALYIYELQ